MQPRRSLVYRIWQIFVVIGALPFVMLLLATLLNVTSPATSSLYLETPLEVPVRLISGLLIAPLTVILGIVCFQRTQGNMVGLLLITLGYGTASSQGFLIIGYSASVWEVLLANIGTSFFWISFLLIPLYFPSGRVFPLGFERWCNRFVLACLALWFLILPIADSTVFWGFPDNPLIEFPNPLYISAIAPLTGVLRNLGVPSIFILLGMSVVTLFIRYRRSELHERLQIRWVIGSMVFIFGITFLADPLKIPILSQVFVPILATFMYPAAVSYAILRHRLYDIDIIIRRTLIYSILSAILAGVYLGTVILVQQLFQSATGDVPDFAIVISTLLIAGLFTPVRRRVQDVIDRRFYRRKYNVEQTLAQFSQTLRDEVDIEVLKGQLVSVVQDTMQPSSIRLWVKENKS